jgi:vitamin B12 transporter
MNKLIFPSLMLVGLALPVTSKADDTQQDALSDVLVTATRSDTKKNELATAMTVFTREDIENLQVRTLPELIKGSTGLDVVQSGGYGQPASIFMRGSNSNQILVLIDGIRAGSVSLGTSAFELLPIDQIERVEIIRGPQSSLYGSEAIGGVIQIFTRKGKMNKTPSLSVNAGGGSYNTHTESGTLSGKIDNTTYSVGASNLQSDGFKAYVTPPFGANPNGYGYRNTAVNARVGQKFDKGEIESFFMRAEGTNLYDLGYIGGPNKREFVSQVVGLSGSWDIFEQWRTSLKVGQTQDDQTNFSNTQFSSLFNTARWNVSWLNQLTFNKNHNATLGIDYRLDQLQSDTVFTKNSRYDYGLFGELHNKVYENQFLNSSIRWDNNQTFGNVVTGNIGWRSNWHKAINTFANFGNAFKAPTFNDLYYPGQNNPNLKPENSRSVEVGASGSLDVLNWELRAYHTNIDNLINWAPNSSGVWLPSNIDKAVIEGIEVELGWKLMGWQHKLNGNLLSPKDAQTHLLLPSRSQETISYDLSSAYESWDYGAKVMAQTGRFADTANNDRLGGYLTIDLRTGYHFDKSWSISAKLNNLLDKQYQTNYDTVNMQGYANFGRNFFVTLHYNF